MEYVPGENAMICHLKDEKIIVANTLIGEMDGEFQFYINDGSSRGRK